MMLFNFKKRKFRTFPNVRFCSKPKKRNLGNPGKFYFTLIFVYEIQDPRQRKLQLCMNFAVLFNKKKKCPRFPSFQFWPISKIKKTEILESLLYFNFETQDPQTTKIIWDKENYNFTMWFNKKNNENFRGF